jgi:hypothetical protein
MQQFLSTETLIIELLLITSHVAIVVRRLRIPYTVALVVVGLLLTAQSTVKFTLTLSRSWRHSGYWEFRNGYRY